MKTDHPSLPGMEPQLTRVHDYAGLFPGRIFPSTNIDVLERSGNLLFIKSYPHTVQGIPEAQRAIWSLLVRHGEVVDGPGNITVVCVWGVGESTREYIVFDHMGMSNLVRSDRDGFRSYLHGWFNLQPGRRR